MKLTEQQKERYIAACTSAICRCLIPNVIEIVLNLNNIKKPTLKVFTRGAGNEDNFHLTVILTDADSMSNYFKKVKFLYGEAIVGISLRTSKYFGEHIRLAANLILSGEHTDCQELVYDFSTVPDYMGLTIDSKNWHTLGNSDDLRFEPMDLERVLNEDDK